VFVSFCYVLLRWLLEFVTLGARSLGFVLYKSGRALGRAVSELELVVKEDPESPAALYYY
jgi:hypothetical protein